MQGQATDSSVKLETYQAMLWFSSKSIIQTKGQNGKIGIFFNGTKIMGNQSKFISPYWKHQENTLFILDCCQHMEL